MKIKGIVAVVVCILFTSCKKSDNTPDIPVNEKFTFSGIVKAPNGAPLQGVQVKFENVTNNFEVTTDASGKYLFETTGIGRADVYFYGKPLRYLDMRDRRVDFGKFDQTNDKTLVPWEIEEIALLTTNFTDNIEKTYSLVHYNFDELKIEPSDFKNLESSIHLPNYETTFTSIQSSETREVTVSFYSMPLDSGYTMDTNNAIAYSDALGWKKILTITTTTTPVGVLEPVSVNLAAAYANHSEYNHSGTIIMVSEEINETLGVTSSVDLLEIRLPYGDDF